MSVEVAYRVIRKLHIILSNLKLIHKSICYNGNSEKAMSLKPNNIATVNIP